MPSVRGAWGLGRGSHVAIPTEFFTWATKVRLRASETLTLVALLAEWRIDEDPVVEVSLDRLREATGLSKGQQGATMNDLATIRPPLFRVREGATVRSPRSYDLRPLLRVVRTSATISRVRPTGHGPRPVDKTLESGPPDAPVRPTGRKRPAHRTQGDDIHRARVSEESRIEESPESLRGLSPEQLRATMFRPGPDGEAARTEWARRKSEGRR